MGPMMEDANLKILAANMRRALRAPEECDIPYLLARGAAELERLRIENAGQAALLRIAEVEHAWMRERAFMQPIPAPSSSPASPGRPGA